MKEITLSLMLSKPRLIGRAQLNGVSKGGEHPLWSRVGFKPSSRIQWILQGASSASIFLIPSVISTAPIIRTKMPANISGNL